MAQSVRTEPEITPPPGPLTYEEFLDWAADVHAEWVDGEVIVEVSTGARHSRLVIFLLSLLDHFLRLHRLGEVLGPDYQMRLRSQRTGREPDVMVILAAHRDRIQERYLDGPADLVCELISDDSVERDRLIKRQEYAAAGIPEYVLVETRAGKAGVEWLRLGPDGQYAPTTPDEQGRLHSAVLPGFWLDPAWLLAELPPDPFDALLAIAPDAVRRRLAG